MVGRSLRSCFAFQARPPAVVTSFDGYPMAQKGQGGFALQVAVVSSSLGGIASAFALMLLAPPLARVTLLFGPSEVFWVAVFGLCSIIFLLGGNPVKGIASACFGVFVSVVGADTITGDDRYTFGQLELLDGVSIVILLVGPLCLAARDRPAGIALEDRKRGRRQAGDRTDLAQPAQDVRLLENLDPLGDHRHLDRHPARSGRFHGRLRLL